MQKHNHAAQNYLAFRQRMSAIGISKPLTQEDIEKAREAANRRRHTRHPPLGHARILVEARAAAMRQEFLLQADD